MPWQGVVLLVVIIIVADLWRRTHRSGRSAFLVPVQGRVIRQGQPIGGLEAQEGTRTTWVQYSVEGTLVQSRFEATGTIEAGSMIALLYDREHPDRVSQPARTPSLSVPPVVLVAVTVVLAAVLLVSYLTHTP